MSSVARQAADAPRPPQKRAGGQMISPTNKKTKTSPEDREKEKAAKLAEKLAKDAAREAEKAAKEAAREAEKATKDAEREARETEREAKRLEREEKKKVRDEAKAKEVAAQEKKERSQLRMVNFFKKADPKPTNIMPVEANTVFKPFHLKENTTWTRHVRSAREPEQFESELASLTDAPTVQKTLRATGTRSSGLRRGRTRQTWKTLRERLLEVSSVPLEERFKDMAYKLLQFHTDVRPAYFGTMTKIPAAPRLARGRNPHIKTDELQYDYDSEADWIEGDDDDAGEELGDDDEMSDASGDTYGEDGEDDFVDDAEDSKPKGLRNQQGQLIPSILGIFSASDCEPVAHMQLRRLIDTSFPIDPFENYWDPSPVLVVSNKVLNGPIGTVISSTSSSDSCTRKSSSSTTSFPNDLLPAFKKAIQGCNLTKILLVEKLRVDFKPYKVSKKAIEDKLSEVAQRQGKGQHDVWTLKT